MPLSRIYGSPSIAARLGVVAAVVLAFAIPAAFVIVAGVNHGPRFDDQNEYHLPTVWQIANEWPHLAVNQYPAAMTPGYHALMTPIACAGGGVREMRAATALLTCGLLATLAWAISRRVPLLDGVLLCLPVAWSPYFFTAGIYVIPHNLGWWCVLGAMLLALRPKRDVTTIVGFALLFAVQICVLQIQAWILAPMLVGTWFSRAMDDRVGEGMLDRRRLGRFAAVLLAAVPGFLILAWFATQWGGLAPKTQGWVRPVKGINFAVLAMILATCGALGTGYIARYCKPTSWRGATVAAAIAAIVALIPATTYDQSAGRWTGLWNLAGKLPSVAERSPVIVLLATVGGFVLGMMFVAVPRRERWIFAAALAGFVAAHATINQAWQRYYEPMILISFVLAAAHAGSRTSRQMVISRVLLVALTIAQAGFTILSLRGQ